MFTARFPALVFAFVALLAACGDSSDGVRDSGVRRDSGSGVDGSFLDGGLPQDPAPFARFSGNPVLNPRDMVSPITGNRSVVSIGDPCAVWDPDANLWRVYFNFFDHEAELASLPSTGIFGATSADGTSFQENAVLSVNQQGTFDADTVETCDVVLVDDPANPGEQLFQLFYSGSSNNGTDSLYYIALATSRDGVVFTPLNAAQARNGVAGVLFGPSEALGSSEEFGNFVTDPTVVVRNGRYHMWTLCIQGVPTPNGGVCYHTSSDAIRWQHHGLVSGLTRGFPIQPSVYFNDQTDRFEMIVVMDTEEEERLIHDLSTNLTLRVTGFFHATSQDGMNWVQSSTVRALAEDLSESHENRGLATGADAEYRDGIVFLFYPSFTTVGGSVPTLPSLLNWPLNVAKRRAAGAL